PPSKAGDVDGLLHTQKLDVKNQGRVGWNHPACSPRAVTELRRNAELPLAADFHAFHALVPSLDHLARAESEFERLAPVQRAVKCLAVSQPPGVMHGYVLARCGRGAGAFHEVPVLQAARRGDRLSSDRRGSSRMFRLRKQQRGQCQCGQNDESQLSHRLFPSLQECAPRNSTAQTSAISTWQLAISI